MDDPISPLEHCELCPRRCGVNRLRGERGFCRAPGQAVIAHYGLHHGEEPPISGNGGSGTVFFSPCNLRCVFCQNYQISHVASGEAVSVEDMIGIFFNLEKRGAHNINLVSPTPYAPLIGAAIKGARERGLSVPFLYNTNSYENRTTIAAMAGLIDIYLPDLKYWSASIGEKLSAGPGYPQAAKAAIEEMHDQVGDLVIEGGIAKRGLLIRHLVLPGGLAGTTKVIGWIKDLLGSETAVSLMSQYYPVCRAHEYAIINRRIRNDEYEPLVALLDREGFRNVFLQELESASGYLPDFEKERPFEGS